MKNRILIGLASTIFVSGVMKPVPAFAQKAPATETYVRVVSAADLNLRSKPGRRQLDQRIAAAVREVCGTASVFDLLGKNEVRRCRDKASVQAKARSKALLAGAGGGDTQVARRDHARPW
jgi:UrcA family protein